MKSTWMLKAAKIIGFLIVGSVALGLVVMLLWNAVVPELFGGPVITFWQSVGLLLLSHILLRSWGPWRYSGKWRHDRWKHHLEEKLAAMTPEERDKFKEEWRRRCGWEPGGTEVKNQGG
jgi:hypothetical protein